MLPSAHAPDSDFTRRRHCDRRRAHPRVSHVPRHHRENLRRAESWAAATAETTPAIHRLRTPRPTLHAGLSPPLGIPPVAGLLASDLVPCPRRAARPHTGALPVGSPERPPTPRKRTPGHPSVCGRLQRHATPLKGLTGKSPSPNIALAVRGRASGALQSSSIVCGRGRLQFALRDSPAAFGRVSSMRCAFWPGPREKQRRASTATTRACCSGSGAHFKDGRAAKRLRNPHPLFRETRGPVAGNTVCGFGATPVFARQDPRGGKFASAKTNRVTPNPQPGKTPATPRVSSHHQRRLRPPSGIRGGGVRMAARRPAPKAPREQQQKQRQQQRHRPRFTRRCPAHCPHFYGQWCQTRIKSG
jgi:hypothetical protein